MHLEHDFEYNGIDVHTSQELSYENEIYIYHLV